MNNNARINIKSKALQLLLIDQKSVGISVKKFAGQTELLWRARKAPVIPLPIEGPIVLTICINHFQFSVSQILHLLRDNCFLIKRHRMCSTIIRCNKLPT